MSTVSLAAETNILKRKAASFIFDIPSVMFPICYLRHYITCTHQI